MIRPMEWARHLGAAGTALAAFGAYLWIFLPHFPAHGAGWGDDYALYFPNFLAGYFWYLKNGALAIPWFSPAQCGGSPYFADLNVTYYSLPQWMSFALGPIGAVRVTLGAFAGLGAWGFYVLSRTRFRTSRPAAVCAAVLFLFNGFFAARMMVGHITFHPFMLTPWLAWSLLASQPAQATLWRRVGPAVAGGLLLSYMFHGGMIHALPAVVLSVMLIVLIHSQLFGHRRAPWIALGCAIFLSIALGAQRLAAALAFIDQFPRAEYVLPGFPNPLDALQMALVSLFWRPPAFVAQSRMLGSQWRPELHEWAFGVGPAALLLLLAGAWVLAREHAAKGGAPRRSADRVAVWVAVVALLAVPIALNWHHPTWTGFLKELPVFRSSSSLVRWFAAYIPLVALLSGLALDRVAAAGGLRRVIALLVVLTTVAWNAWIDLVGPDSMTYNAAPVDRAWRAARATGDVPAVTRIALSASGPREMPLNRNDSMIDGASQLSCYQPMFGYRLERMPVGVLRPGPALAEAADGVLNVKNPACYVFPLENRCVPGDHFATAQRAEAERFLQYEPFEFVSGALQSVADAVTLGTLALLLIAALLGALSAVAKRWSH